MPPREAQVTASERSATRARPRVERPQSTFARMCRTPFLEQLHIGRVTRRVDSEPRLTRLGVHCDEVHPRAGGWTDRGPWMYFVAVNPQTGETRFAVDA